VKWWTVKVQDDAGDGVQYRTRARTWEQALADISALFPPEEAVNDLGGQDPAPRFGRDELDGWSA
jgi:hypothetical protein